MAILQALLLPWTVRMLRKSQFYSPLGIDDDTQNAQAQECWKEHPIKHL